MNETNKITLIVTKEEAGIRLDQFLFLHKAAISRSKASLIIKNKECLVNSKFEKAHYLVEENDEVSFLPYSEKESQLVPEEVPFEVVYEDDYLLVINKPRGLIVHPGNGHKDKTLVNGLLYRKTKLADTNDYIRPGIVHRIDKDTSGLLVVAKTSQAMLGLQEQLSSHSMHREYKALALGIINENEGKIIAPIGRDKANRIKMCVDLKNGKEAITNFKVIERFKKSNVTYIDCKLE
ncbi:MAG TPA: RNA pseudouridine synthase, partial [Firmicutes bacterium]|nr:RNA pseudouridine synthase [Bacillota bacterium]